MFPHGLLLGVPAPDCPAGPSPAIFAEIRAPSRRLGFLIDEDRRMSPEVLEALYHRHGHGVLRRARQILGDEDEAMDVLHDIFVSLARQPDQFSGRSSMTTWLYSATTHACLNRLRNARTRARLLEQKVVPARATEAAPRGESRVLARELLGALPEDLAMVAVYFYGDEMTLSEIADVMNCSRRHISNLLARLRQRLTLAEASA